MGILNVTPDSFSDGGQFSGKPEAVQQAVAMQDAGADIIDVGGESTRPGAQAVSLQQELDRVIPVIEAIVPQLSVAVSIDTSKPEVMREAVAAGAGMINDVYALRQDGAVQTAVDLEVPVCLMHMQGEPRVMQDKPVYDDVGGETRGFLLERAQRCEEGGVLKKNILLDPGFGFGKTLDQNIELFHSLPDLVSQGYPVLVVEDGGVDDVAFWIKGRPETLTRAIVAEAERMGVLPEQVAGPAIVAAAGVIDLPVLQIPVEPSLVERGDRAEAH